jgi:hypothetical protein
MREAVKAAWCSHDLAQRFSAAMSKARSELQGGSFTAIVRRAWASDPNLRGEFGAAISAGLRRMWSSDVRRAEQSLRTRKSYTLALRKRRSEALKKRWADLKRARPVPDDHDRRRRREAADTTNRRFS